MGHFSYAKLFLLLEKKGIKQYQLQEIAGFTAPTMSKLVKGQTIKTDTLAKICEALDCQPGDIMEYRSDTKIPEISEKILDDLYDRYSVFHDTLTKDDFKAILVTCIETKADQVLVINQNKLTRLVKNHVNSRR